MSKRDAEWTAQDWKDWVRFVFPKGASPPDDISDTDLRWLVCLQWTVMERQLQEAHRKIECFVNRATDASGR